MDARIARLIIEANEISQYLKKDYVFSTGKDEDPKSNGCVQLMSKSLKVNSKLPVSTFKDTLVILRKLMYEDPSDAALIEADEIIRGGRLRADVPRVDHEEEAIERVDKVQLNLNNCSSCPDADDGNNNSPVRTVKVTKSAEKYSPPLNTPHKTLANGNLNERNSNCSNEADDRWKPKELPRKKSLRKFHGIPEQTAVFDLKKSEPIIPLCNDKVEVKSNSVETNDSSLHTFLNVCRSATYIIEKDLQESGCEFHFCTKILNSCNTLFEILTFFKETYCGKLSDEFQLRCLQAVSHLQSLSVALSNISSSKELETQNNTPQPFELLSSLQSIVSYFSNLWKALSENSPMLGKQVQLPTKSLYEMVEHLGTLSTSMGYPCPNFQKIQSEMKQEFMSGSNKAAFSKIESNLIVVNHCYNLLETESDDQKQMDTDKLKWTLICMSFSLVRLIKQLLVMVRQIQEELHTTEAPQTVEQADISEILYGQSVSLVDISTKLTEQTEAFTRSSLALIPATDVTILTLKRVSKNVAQVEETARSLIASFLHGTIECIMAQDQMEALSEVQSLIDICCMDLRSLLLDGISLGISKEDSPSSLSANPQPFSLMNRTIHKRVLPATPRDHSKLTTNNSSQLVSNSKVFRHINRSPQADPTFKSTFARKQGSLDRTEEFSAFERPDHRNAGFVDNHKRLEMLGEEVTKDVTQTNNPSTFVQLRRNPNVLRYYAHRHSFMQ